MSRNICERYGISQLIQVPIGNMFISPFPLSFEGQREGKRAAVWHPSYRNNSFTAQICYQRLPSPSFSAHPGFLQVPVQVHSRWVCIHSQVPPGAGSSSSVTDAPHLGLPHGCSHWESYLEPLFKSHWETNAKPSYGWMHHMISKLQRASPCYRLQSWSFISHSQAQLSLHRHSLNNFKLMNMVKDLSQIIHTQRELQKPHKNFREIGFHCEWGL